MKAEIGKGVWNESEEGWLDPRSKLNEKQSTIGTHEAVVYCPMIDWKIKNRPWLHVGRVRRPGGVTPLKMFVYNKILLTFWFEQME